MLSAPKQRAPDEETQFERKTANKQHKPERVLFNFAISRKSESRSVPIVISGHHTHDLVDTGSTCSLINENLVYKLKFKSIHRKTPLKWFDGTVRHSFVYTQSVDAITAVDHNSNSTNKEKLFKLMEIFSALCTSGTCVNTVNTGKLSITLTENKMVYYHPYRMSESEREIVHNLVSDLIQIGILRESIFSFASPVIFAKKNYGSYRLPMGGLPCLKYNYS